MFLKWKYRLLENILIVWSHGKNYSMLSSSILPRYHFPVSRFYGINYLAQANFRLTQVIGRAGTNVDDVEANLTENEIMLRGGPGSYKQECILHTFIVSKCKANDGEWENLKNQILKEKYGRIKENNVDGFILEECIRSLNFPLGKSYFIFLQKKFKKMKLGHICQYLKLCFLFRTKCDEDDIARIIRFCDGILEKCTLLDEIVGESLAMGYCVAKKSDKCLKVIEKIEKLKNISNVTYAAAILSLLYCNEFEKMWKVMNQVLEKNIKLSKTIYLDILDNCSDYESVIRLLNVFAEYDIKPCLEVVRKITKLFAEFENGRKLFGNFTYISNLGKCKNCGELLKSSEVDDADFAKLRKRFLDTVVIGDDVFCRSSPNEVRSFLTFVKNTSPYDIVIDSLNIVYSMNIRHPLRRSARIGSPEALETVVKYFADRNKRILVVGKKHLLSNCSQDQIKYLKKNAHLFFVDHNSHDDMFILYAALYSGVDTCFVSRDLMRTQKYFLNDKYLEGIFKQWQISHQYMVTHINLGEQVFFKEPLSFDMGVQQNKEGCWHIPYLQEDIESDQYGKHNDWVCLSRVKKKKMSASILGSTVVRD